MKNIYIHIYIYFFFLLSIRYHYFVKYSLNFLLFCLYNRFMNYNWNFVFILDIIVRARLINFRLETNGFPAIEYLNSSQAREPTALSMLLKHVKPIVQRSQALRHHEIRKNLPLRFSSTLSAIKHESLSHRSFRGPRYNLYFLLKSLKVNFSRNI